MDDNAVVFEEKFDLLNLEPQKVSKDISSYTFMLYAPPKFGKTTFVYDLFGQEALFIRTEKGTKVLAGLMGVDVASWSDMIMLKTKLFMTKDKLKQKVIIIDTVDNLWNFLETFVCNKYGVSPTDINKANGGYGKGYKEMSYEWFTVFKDIEEMGFTLCFISHAEKKMEKLTIGDKEQEFEKFFPSIQERGMKIITKMVDSILFAYLTVDQNGQQVQALYTRETLQFQAGSRFSKYMNPILPYNPKSYKEALITSIEKIEAERGSEFMKEEKEENSLKETTYNYEQVMLEAKTLGMQLYNAGRKHELDELAEKHFGEGAKLTNATPQQIESLVLAVNELREMVKVNSVA